MKLQKTLLILSASAMLSAAVIAPDVALAQPFPGPPPGGPPPGPVGGPPPGMPGGGLAGLPGPGGPPGAGLPRPPGAGGPRVSLVPADLLVPGPLAFLVLPAPEAVVRASLAATVALTAAPAGYAYGHGRPHRQLRLRPLGLWLRLWIVATPLLALWRLCLQQQF